MNAMVPSLTQGGKMSSSDPNSKIDFLDSPSAIKKKVKAAFCEPGKVEDNGLLAFIKAVILPIADLRRTFLIEHPNETFPLSFCAPEVDDGKILFTISRSAEHGGDQHYSDYNSLEEDYKNEKVHPGDLKNAVTNALTLLLGNVQKEYEKNETWQKAEKDAYPVEKPPEKVGKKKVCLLCP
jgi:tyrosyl-tRNA synthetase